MRAAIYARVSTLKQSPDMQLEALRKFAHGRFEICREYVDIGVSGSKDSRPQLDVLMSDARKRLFSAVLVWKFDRFARSVKHLVISLEEFNHLGIAFISFSENLDTSSPMGRAMFSIIGAMSQLERDLIRERVTAGVRRAIENGKRWGHPKPVDLERVRGMSLRQAAGVLGVSRETIRRRLQA